VSFSSSCWRLAIDTVLEVVWSWQLLRKVVLSRIAGTRAVPIKRSLKTQAFECLNPQGGHSRFLSFQVQPLITPLFFDPHTQLGIFAVALRNIAVPVSFAIDGKLALRRRRRGCPTSETPFETQAFQCPNPQGGHQSRFLSFKVQPEVAPLGRHPRTQLGVLAGVSWNIAVPVDFIIVGKLAQTFFPGWAAAVPFETQAFQCLNPQGGHHSRFLSFKVQPVLIPLVIDPRNQLGVYAVFLSNIAVPVDFVIVGKLAQTGFPGWAAAVPFETHAYQFLDTGECH
jgi:hypothetical protein